MKIQTSKAAYIACVVTALLIGSPQLQAGSLRKPTGPSRDIMEARQAERGFSTGEFFGYDQKTRKVWIDDFVYQLSANCRVIGSSTKLGLLSKITHRERVKFKTAPNPKHSSIPLITEIYRK